MNQRQFVDSHALDCLISVLMRIRSKYLNASPPHPNGPNVNHHSQSVFRTTSKLRNIPSILTQKFYSTIYKPQPNQRPVSVFTHPQCLPPATQFPGSTRSPKTTLNPSPNIAQLQATSKLPYLPENRPDGTAADVASGTRPLAPDIASPASMDGAVSVDVQIGN